MNVVQKIASMLYDISRCNQFEFARQTSRCVTFDSSEGTARLSMIPLSYFEDDPPLCSIISLLLEAEAEAEYDEKIRRFFKCVAKIRLWNSNQAYNQV